MTQQMKKKKERLEKAVKALIEIQDSLCLNDYQDVENLPEWLCAIIDARVTIEENVLHRQATA